MTGISISQLADDKIAEHWLNFDSLGMLQQLGTVPASGPTLQECSWRLPS